MLRAIRIWLATRWFMKHWQFNREVSRHYAVQRVNRVDRDRKQGARDV